jgi:cytochrome c peroxidase
MSLTKIIFSTFLGAFCVSALAACGQGADGFAGDESAIGSAASADLSTLVDPVTLAAIPTNQTLDQRTAQCQQDPRVTLGLVALNVCVGADLFFRDTFNGNGRSCATCHPTANNFTQDPPFIATLAPSDPIFIAENDATLAGLERPDLMRNFGLILENVDGLDAPTTKFVMRSVPHMFSLSTTITPNPKPTDGTTLPPNERTGWGGDGSPSDVAGTSGLLRDFQDGAIRQHYTLSLNRVPGTDFTFATAEELDDISAFTHTIGRMNDIDITKIVLTDSAADTGRTTFIAKPCNVCHHNAGANFSVDGFNRNFNTGIDTARLGILDQEGIPHDGGFGNTAGACVGNPTSTCFGNGTFNTPPLIEAPSTPPFFHNNLVNTIEEAINFYTTAQFGGSPSGAAVGGPIVLSVFDVNNIGRFLRVLNASFNCQLASTRLNASAQLAANLGVGTFEPIQDATLKLAAIQLQDAVTVLSSVRALNVAQQTSLRSAISFINQAVTATTTANRESAISSALALVNAANAGLTTNAATITFTMGPGTLLF